MKFSNTEAQISTDGFTFKSLPTKEQTQVFEYVAFDYIDKQPGYVSETYSSFVGIYFSPDGKKTGSN